MGADGRSLLEEQWVEVFDAAGHGRDWPRASEDVAAIAGNYEPEFHEAPVKLDHADGGPAGAWVLALKADGTRLLARFGQVAGWFAELVRSGQFKKRSVELYRDLQGRGPYLRAVAFLGAAAPEVKGLRDIAFGEDEPDFEQFEADWGAAETRERAPVNNGLAAGDGAVGLADGASEFAEADPVEFAEAALSELREENLRLRDELRQLQVERHRVEFERFLEQQAEAGKPTGAWIEAGAVDLYLGLDGVESFGDGAGVAPRETLKAILSATPALVRFGELAREEARAPRPLSAEVSVDSVELAEQAEAWLEEHPGRSFAEALAAVAR